uniref:Uncharacterized protein n=1 Tax=Glossina pallidipes TaxID=7398 RepID=A0A1A9Z552_GLOPL
MYERPFECRQLRNMVSADIRNFYQNDLWRCADGFEKRLRIDGKVNKGIEVRLKERLLCIQKEIIINFAENCKQKQSAIQTIFCIDFAFPCPYPMLLLLLLVLILPFGIAIANIIASRLCSLYAMDGKRDSNKTSTCSCSI